MRRICLFGGPGCGKSTLAAKLFSQAKAAGVNAELVTEYIKSWAWAKRPVTSWDQYYVFSKQLHHEDRVLRHGTVVVTDSPLWLQIAYMKRAESPFASLCADACRMFDRQYPAANFILTRPFAYAPEGRWETETQAVEMDSLIRKTIIELTCQEINPAEATWETVCRKMSN